MKKVVATIALVMLTATAMSASLLTPFSFKFEYVPKFEVLEEYSFEIEVPRNAGLTETYFDVADIEAVANVFHFTRAWWFRDRLMHAKISRDARAISRATEDFEFVEAEIMNDLLEFGAPRELVILDEPE